MFKQFTIWCVILIIVRFIFSMVGGYLLRGKKWIVCSDDGYSWKVVSDSGNFFLVAHVESLIMLCIMTRTLFGKVAIKVNLIPDKKKSAATEMKKEMEAAADIDKEMEAAADINKEIDAEEESSVDIYVSNFDLGNIQQQPDI